MPVFDRIIKNRELVFVAGLGLCVVLLLALPTGFEKAHGGSAERVKALVLETDNGGLRQFGIVKTGSQGLKVRVLGGRFRGRELDAVNVLTGKMELDKVFAPGDRALVVLDLDAEGRNILHANPIDHYRINVELLLALAFVVLLVLFAGWTGLKALLSFAITGLVIWKILLPAFLNGWRPVPVTLGVVTLLTGVIIFLVGGLTRKGLVAFLGAFAGIVVTCLLSLAFGAAFRLHGAVRPFSETLLYSGYPHLDLKGIFLSGIFLASSGAVMDLAMDVAASMQEVVERDPCLSRRELVRSGFRVGRAVIGTMTTTLLLAYSGGFTALLLLLMAQGIPLVNVFNMTYVSAEILHTLVGSFGLVTVAPLTALIGGRLLAAQTPSAGGHRQPFGAAAAETWPDGIAIGDGMRPNGILNPR